MFIFSHILIAASLTPAGPAESLLNQVPPQTKSSEYAWLETDNSRTKQFTATAKQEVQKALQQSTNLPKIEEFLLKRYPAEVDSLSETILTPDRKFVLSRKAYTSIVSDSQNGVLQKFFQRVHFCQIKLKL